MLDSLWLFGHERQSPPIYLYVRVAARALTNLAALGQAVGQEEDVFVALVQLTRSHVERVREEAAHALSIFSFQFFHLTIEIKRPFAAAGRVQALVALAQSFSEANSIAIGREGGVAPLIALARSKAEDVRHAAAGALWNLTFNPGNALRIVEEDGVAALGDICSSSVSKMARFNSALALAYMFDGTMDEFALVGPLSESVSKSVGLDGARRMALEHIEAFVRMFSNQQAFAAAAVSSAPAALAHFTESARIQEVGNITRSGAEVGRFVTMLQSPSSILNFCSICSSTVYNSWWTTRHTPCQPHAEGRCSKSSTQSSRCSNHTS
ncbi:hypothetical protein TSUD_388450 [Trifolium subterraneum]|uniref:Armadillo repeat-containing domain-containing protein n=1 Tax=Trifolium subterraneum TaxID=3900 RepID=A0A2Z6MF61_TRISU|nr:hypothetical protein TSUD_388450 [Trifolium subterraneum]